ncbi:MAG: RNA polymerase sigma factor [Phycisphaerae bacterium]
MDTTPASGAIPIDQVPAVGDGDYEAMLVARAQRDRNAFGDLYRLHHTVIARYIHRRVGDTHLTEDLVADVFVIAMESIRRYRNRGVPFRAWLYRVASNRVNRWARRERKKLLVGAEAEFGELPSPDALNMDQEIARERARRALLCLPPKYQAVLALHYLEGMPVNDVATTLGCRVGTVKSRLSRGREQMRALLKSGR